MQRVSEKSQPTIRAAKPSEASLLSSIAFGAKRHWGYSPATLQSWTSVLTIAGVDIETNLTCVALHDDQPMGFYMVSTNMSEWELEHLWILPKFMRRGVGRALLMHAAEVVSERGGTELHIDADPNAEAFYSACGAVRVGSVAAPIAEDFERTLPRLVLALRSRPLSGQ